MKNEQLIERLADGLVAVKPLPSPLRRTFFWLLATAAMLGGFLLWHDGTGREVLLQHAGSRAQLGVLSLLACVSAFAAFSLAAPGEWRNWRAMLPLAAIGVWAWMLSPALTDFSAPHAGGWMCAVEVSCLSLPPALLLIFMLRRGAPSRLVIAGLFAVLAAAAVGALATQLTCCNTVSTHLVFWHFLPVLVLAGLGMACGRRLLRW